MSFGFAAFDLCLISSLCLTTFVLCLIQTPFPPPCSRSHLASSAFDLNPVCSHLCYLVTFPVAFTSSSFLSVCTYSFPYFTLCSHLPPSVLLSNLSYVLYLCFLFIYFYLIPLFLSIPSVDTFFPSCPLFLPLVQGLGLVVFEFNLLSDFSPSLH